MDTKNQKDESLVVGIAQIAPIFLNKSETIKKVVEYVELAAQKKCDVVGFGEALIPGYPFWIDLTNGSKFNSDVQKKFFSRYLKESVDITNGDLDPIIKIAKKKKIAASDRGGHSVYCSLVYISQSGTIDSVHRKLMPTYEERLVWSHGDGHGLQTHKLRSFTLGGLNCWENWIPLARSALYGQGEDLHFAVWPGSKRNTFDITKFIAKESRSFVVSISGFLKREHVEEASENIPCLEALTKILDEKKIKFLANGGSCVASPNGKWLIEPIENEEVLTTCTVHHWKVREERHNFDLSGHYSRPDVLSMTVNKKRQNVLKIID